MKKILLVLLGVLTLSGCEVDSNVEIPGEDIEIYEDELDIDLFSNRDYNEEIYFDKVNVLLESNTTYTITKEGSYTISGIVVDSQILIDTDDKVQLIFNDLSITNDELACLYVKSADKVFVQLVGENSLSSNVTNEQDDNVNGVIFARDDLTFNGNGSLSLLSTSNGIVAKDDLTFTNGSYYLNTTLDAIEVNDTLAITNSLFDITTNDGYTSKNSSLGSTKGLKCDDFIYIKDGTFTINSYDDAIHSDGDLIIDGGNFLITTNDDAITSTYSLYINGGEFDINYCYEGLEAQRVNVCGGEILIDSYDDGINASIGDVDDFNGCFINISGGNIIITIITNSPEADGLDSNGDILITGGDILIHGTTNTKDTPLDYDGSAYITGGSFLTTGSYSMTLQNFNSSLTTQGCIAYQLSTTSFYSGTITLKDSNGNIVVSYESVNNFQMVHISTSDIVIGETYYLFINNTSYTIKMDSITYSNFSTQSNKPSGRP